MDSNCDEYHLHARAVHHLVELRGGLDKLGMKGFLAWSIVMYSIPIQFSLLFTKFLLTHP